MRLTRTYIDAALAPGARIGLPEASSAHLLRVLRLAVGDACVLFNGDGHDYRAHLLAVTKKGAEVEIAAVAAVGNQSPLRITLAQALARGDKMDWIIQKATELGVAAIQPIVTERTEVKLDAQRSEQRLAHWRAVAIAACEQCGRADVPQVAAPLALAQFAAPANDGTTLRLTLDPDGALQLRTLAIEPRQAIAIAIGPEGGLSERDLATLTAAGFRGLRLGPRVLRTETAGVATIAALQAVAGDFC